MQNLKKRIQMNLVADGNRLTEVENMYGTKGGRWGRRVIDGGFGIGIGTLCIWNGWASPYMGTCHIAWGILLNSL